MSRDFMVIGELAFGISAIRCSLIWHIYFIAVKEMFAHFICRWFCSVCRWGFCLVRDIRWWRLMLQALSRMRQGLLAHFCYTDVIKLCGARGTFCFDFARNRHCRTCFIERPWPFLTVSVTVDDDIYRNRRRLTDPYELLTKFRIQATDQTQRYKIPS